MTFKINSINKINASLISTQTVTGSNLIGLPEHRAQRHVSISILLFSDFFMELPCKKEKKTSSPKGQRSLT